MFPDIYQTVDLFDGLQLSPACPCDKGMERGWEDNRQEKTKHLNKDMYHCQFFQLRSHVDWPGTEFGPQYRGASD